MSRSNRHLKGEPEGIPESERYYIGRNKPETEIIRMNQLHWTEQLKYKPKDTTPRIQYEQGDSDPRIDMDNEDIHDE